MSTYLTIPERESALVLAVCKAFAGHGISITTTISGNSITCATGEAGAREVNFFMRGDSSNYWPSIWSIICGSSSPASELFEIMLHGIGRLEPLSLALDNTEYDDKFFKDFAEDACRRLRACREAWTKIGVSAHSLQHHRALYESHLGQIRASAAEDARVALQLIEKEIQSLATPQAS